MRFQRGVDNVVAQEIHAVHAHDLGLLVRFLRLVALHGAAVDVVEVISTAFLREHLQLSDGDHITISL